MENKSYQQPLLLENAVKWLTVKFKENQVPLLASFVMGILAHMFVFTNKLVNHDEVYTLFYKGGTVSLGRWGLGFLDCIFPNYSMPWIYGIITLLLISASVCIIVHILSIRGKLLQILLAGTIITFPSLTGTFSYMFTSSSYAVGFFLAVLAVWLLQKQPRKLFLPALACMILSLSIYQSYVAVSASLLVIILIQRLLHEENIAPIIQQGFLFVGFLILSLGLYYVATQLINLLLGTGFNGYANGNISFSLTSIPSDIVEAYRTFFLYFTEGYRGLIPTLFSRRVHYVCFAAIGILLFIWGFAQKQKNIPRFLLLLAMIVILPLAINCMHLFTTTDAVHTLVLYGFVAVYILAIVITDACIPILSLRNITNLLRHALLNVITLALAGIIIVNTYIANEAYLTLYLRYENAYAFYTSLVADIKMMPEFDEETKLALIGTYQEPSYYLEKFYFSDHITGIDGFLPDVYSKDRFVEYYLGFPITFASDAEIAEIMQSPEYEGMATYPYYGSMQMIGDYLVVRLS